MNAPRFRSTAAFALRARNKAPAVERATFVTFSLGGHRLAAAVEAVERVLRWSTFADDATPTGVTTHVRYADRDVPLVDLAERLGVTPESSRASRVLVLNVASGWVAVVVDAVHEIATVDAASIALVGSAPAGTANDDMTVAPVFPGARGTFVKDGRDVLVLDVARALGYRFT